MIFVCLTGGLGMLDFVCLLVGLLCLRIVDCYFSGLGFGFAEWLV